MKPLPTFVLLILWPFLSWSQVNPKGQVHGRILDADTRLPLSGASVSLVVAKDSSRTDYSAFSNESGGFSIPGISDGVYRAFISYLGYEALLLPRVIEVNGQPVALGDVLLNKKGLTLRQVEIITSKSPFVVRNDTIEYNVDYYKPRETSPLEELLKKLPGLEVAPDGQIRYNGVLIETILVDGKPFFGKNAKLASKNLLSGIIDRIQIIERQPDISDENAFRPSFTEKALNLVLKKEKHNKISGLVAAGGGLSDRFAVKASLNQFKERSQISILGGGNNINEFEDNMFVPNNLIRNWQSGINFTREVGSNISLSANYSINNLRSTGNTESIKHIYMNDSSYDLSQISLSNNTTTLNTLNIGFSYKIDSFSVINFSSQVNSKKEANVLESIFKGYSKDTEINKSSQMSNGTDFNEYFITGLHYIRNSRDKGRVFKISLNLIGSNTQNRTINNSVSSYYLPNSIKGDTLNQLNHRCDRINGLKINLMYSQALFGSAFIDFVNTYNKTKTSVNKEVLDYVPALNKYDLLLDSLTGSMNVDIKSNKTTMNFRVKQPKYDLSLGINMFLQSQMGDMSSNTDKFHVNFLQFYPSANFELRINSNIKLQFEYDNRIQTPTIVQLFPMPDLSNQLFVFKGNPKLRIGRVNAFNLSYTSLNSQTQNVILFSATGGINKDQILSSLSIDSMGRQVSTPFNYSGAFFARPLVSYSVPLKDLGATIGASSSFLYSRDYNSLNGEIFQIDRVSINQGLSINYKYKEKIEAFFTAGFALNEVSYSVYPITKARYSNWFFSVDQSINLPYGFRISSYFNFNYLSLETITSNQQRFIVNFAITKSFLKNEKGSLKIQAFDLFNENNVSVRNITSEYTEDVQSLSLKRFILLSMIYYLK